MNKLTDKQKRFADEYLIDLNATQAAIRAGYSEKTAKEQGHRLLTNIHIRSYIQEKQKLLEEKTGVTIEWVIKELIDTYEHCRQKIAVLDSEGNETGEWRFEPSSAVRSLELLGKHLGMFKDKFELTGKDGKPIQTQNATTVTSTAERVMDRLSEIGSAVRNKSDISGSDTE